MSLAREHRIDPQGDWIVGLENDCCGFVVGVRTGEGVREGVCMLPAAHPGPHRPDAMLLMVTTVAHDERAADAEDVAQHLTDRVAELTESNRLLTRSIEGVEMRRRAATERHRALASTVLALLPLLVTEPPEQTITFVDEG